MTEEAGEHAAKHARRKAIEIDPSKVRLHFARHTQETLNEVMDLVAATGNQKSVAEILPPLKVLVSGKATALTAIHFVKNITDALEVHTKETGDRSAKDKWGFLMAQMYAIGGPFTLVQKPKDQARG